MFVEIEKKSWENEPEKIEWILQEYICAGIVNSVSQMENQWYKIRLNLHQTRENASEICRILDYAGYSTKIVGARTHAQKYARAKAWGYVRNKTRAMVVYRTKHGIIILAKVNRPNRPQNPATLPNPNGTKPEKRIED